MHGEIWDAMSGLVDNTAKYYKLNEFNELKRDTPAIKAYIKNHLFQNLSDENHEAILENLSNEAEVRKILSEALSAHSGDSVSMVDDENWEDFVEVIALAAQKHIHLF